MTMERNPVLRLAKWVYVNSELRTVKYSCDYETAHRVVIEYIISVYKVAFSISPLYKPMFADNKKHDLPS